MLFFLGIKEITKTNNAKTNIQIMSLSKILESVISIGLIIAIGLKQIKY